ncbi:DUF6902 family protein [Phycobacter sp. K97]|uniref:DUF6902 family protein n=1 Tax=Phycobacter sedimenti TaxID=3133977 RepID=UPI00311E77AF
MTGATTAQLLSFPSQRMRAAALGRAAGPADLCASFATGRQDPESVFWLKENAELLNILECTGAAAPAGAFAPYAEYYDTVERRMSFFRPYYRFILSICLDLEDLGFAAPSKGEALAHWVKAQDLPGAELSDLQRAEARRLLARRGVEVDLPGLDARLRAFTEASHHFALPNKKIGYELTHIVFYLSEYGRRDPGLSRAAFRSLEYLGLVSFLDQDADLLAEVAVALSYAGADVPRIWQDWLDRQLAGFEVTEGGFAGQPDDYHTYFVCNWWEGVSGAGSFSRGLPRGATLLRQPGGEGVLRSLSRALFQADPRQFADWERSKHHLADCLHPSQVAILEQAEASSAVFGEFYALFVRSDPAGAAGAMRA